MRYVGGLTGSQVQKGGIVRLGERDDIKLHVCHRDDIVRQGTGLTWQVIKGHSK